MEVPGVEALYRRRGQAPKARVESSAVAARIKAPKVKAVGCVLWGGNVPLPTVGGAWKSGCAFSPDNLSIFQLKKGVWCILGLIKPTLDRPGVLIFLASSRLEGGGAIAPRPSLNPPLPVNLKIGPSTQVWLFCKTFNLKGV